MIRLKRHFVTMLMLALLSGLFSSAQSTPSSKPSCEEFVFSDVHHVPEVDEYEGYNPVTTNLNGRRVGSTIRLGGDNSEGKVEFVGQLKGERLVGKLVWYIGSSRQGKNINLMRKQCSVRPPK